MKARTSVCVWMKKLLLMFGLMICCSAFLLFYQNTVFAETVNEDEVFGDGDNIVSQDNIVKDDVDSELQGNHVGFSGQISANMAYHRLNQENDATGGIQDSDLLANSMTTDLFMDVRLKQGVKAFLSVGGDYYPVLSETEKNIQGIDVSSADKDSGYFSGGIKEVFVDTNLQNKVYFRMGKQVLKWGQGYFWNPSDLLNIEKKDFTDLDSVREGTYGIKTQIPFGVKQNIYLFTDMNDTTDPGTVAQALKYEFLIGNTEMSISALVRSGNKPVWGYDFTSRLGDVDLRGELSLIDGSDCSRFDEHLNAETLDGEEILRACLGFAKGFDQGNIKDRISLTGEFYYNQAGYDRNILQLAAKQGSTVLTSTANSYLANYYSNSKYYAALFSTISKVWGSDTSFNLNAIMNLVDNSALVVTGISYAPSINNITVSLNVGYNLGDKYTEMMVTGERYYVSLETTVKF